MKRTITLERMYDASIEDVWELWTTKEGIESWWGPEGFSVTVLELELRPGGALLYEMTATAPPQIEFMKKAGMPLTTKTRGKITQVVPHRVFAFSQTADFIPGVAPYDANTVVELSAAPNGVRMVMTIDAMHDDVWTQRAVAGWESELGKLAKLLAARKATRTLV